jgi:hypothetical protein
MSSMTHNKRKNSLTHYIPTKFFKKIFQANNVTDEVYH